MIKKLKKTDVIFILTLAVGFLIHVFFLFSAPFSDDESFYSLVPFRILNGDSLVRHEWHLTQFSSLFAYLPVYIWTAIKGSADGIIFFMRCVYLAIHTATAVVVYRFFRKHGVWAIMASMMFYVQVAYYIQAISYQSILAISLLLLSLCLLSVYQNASAKTYVVAGVCFGCCCVCNPMLCLIFVLYFLVCILWLKREKLVSLLAKNKVEKTAEKGKKLTKKQKKQQEQETVAAFSKLENYDCYFNKKAFLYTACGVAIIAVIAIVFFFSTGGTVNSIFNNIENLLNSTEYDVVSKSVFSKIADTFKYFGAANFGIFWIVPPALFLAMIIDQNRKNNTHRFAYITVAIVWSILFSLGIISNMTVYVCGFSLPFFVISLLCYALTENKNRFLFKCAYMPILIFSVFHYLAADTHWAAIGIVLAVANVVGVLFAKDLWNEMRSASHDESDAAEKKQTGALHNIVAVGFCVQIICYVALNFVICNDGNMLRNDTLKAASGPYMNLYMTESKYELYNKQLSDMDYIKSITNEKDTVLLDTYDNYMYLYLDRPMSTYTAWYRGTLNQDLLTEYYEKNPNKVPEYIYISSPNYMVINEMFEYSQEELSAGYLLTVEDYKF